jgi:hypothetical protein
MPLNKALDEMQAGLRMTMEAVKKGETKEAERLLLIVGKILDRLIKARP